MSARREKSRVLNTMRNLQAQGLREEALLVDTAAQVIGGDEAALLLAQRIFDEHFKIHEAN